MTYTIAEMKRLNAAAGGNWFRKDTMEFFDCVIRTAPNRHNLFITSEQDHPRQGCPLYTIRRFNPSDASVLTVGNFQQFPSLEEACAASCAIAAALDNMGSREREILAHATLTEVKDDGDTITFCAPDPSEPGRHLEFDVNISRRRITG